jgi:hypothetical protein
MMTDDMDDLKLGLLSRLPRLESDQTRAKHTREGCHALLRHRRRLGHVLSRIDASRSDMKRRGPRSLAIGIICVLGVVYVSALVATTFDVFFSSPV